MSSDVRRLLPGVLLLAVTAFAGYTVGESIPLLSPLFVVIALGAVIANTVGLPARARRGVASHTLLLETAIVLLGATLPLQTITTAGPLLLGLVLVVVSLGLVFVEVLSRTVGLDRPLGSMLAAGSSICGVSAIAATAAAFDPDDSQIAHAAATILLFDAITLVAFPALGGTLGLDSRTYGVWIGLAMFSTGPVAAAGFAHSSIAGTWATMTKLVRNTLIGAVAVWYSVRYAERGGVEADRSLARIWTDFPKFLVGFVLLCLLANSGILSSALTDSLGRTSDALFLLAFAGLGFEIRIEKVRETGLAPIAVVGTYLLVSSSVLYVVVTTFV